MSFDKNKRSYAVDVELPNEVNALSLAVHSKLGNHKTPKQIADELGIAEYVVLDTMLQTMILHLTHDNIMTLLEVVRKTFMPPVVIDIEGIMIFEAVRDSDPGQPRRRRGD